MAETLLLSAAFSILAAGAYLAVGRVVHRRPTVETNRAANLLFAVWWYGLGLTSLIGAALSLGVYANLVDLPIFVTVTLLNVFLICVALWGLLYYLVFLFTGRPGVLPWLTLFYILYFFLLVYYVIASGPASIETTSWGARLVYDHAITGPLFSVVLILLVFPQILAGLALFALYFRVEDPEQKFRLATVSWSIVIWFGSAYAASVAGIGQNLSWQIASRLIGLGAAFAIYLAYRPPAFLRRRFARTQIDPASEPPPTPPPERHAATMASTPNV